MKPGVVGIVSLWLLLGASAAWSQDSPPPARPLWDLRVEYLFWWIKNDQAAAPLLSTGTPGDPNAGILGQPGTGILFGRDLDYRLNSGTHVVFHYWLDPAQTLGFELGGFALETHTIHGEENSNRTDGSPVIARPFFNTLTNREDAQIITSPQDSLGGRYLGGIDIFSDSRTYGGEASMLLNFMELLGGDEAAIGRWQGLAGVRYLGQKDQLRFSQSSTVLKPGTVGFGGQPAAAPNIVSQKDYFETANHFLGGQLGLRGRRTWGRLSVDGGFVVGLGVNEQQAVIDSRTQLTNSAGQHLVLPGGLYGLPGMLGKHDRHRLSFMSEAEVALAYQLGRRWQASCGYRFLFWNEVARPAEQFSRAVDPRAVPSNLAYDPAAATPTSFQFHSTDFWAQGLTFGLEFRY